MILTQTWKSIAPREAGSDEALIFAALTYYNIHYGLNYIQRDGNVTTYDDYVKSHWDGMLPTSKIDTSSFVPDPSISVPIMEPNFNKEEYAKAIGVIK